MKTANDRKWLIILLVALVGVIELTALQPAQAKTDDKWIIPETISQAFGIPAV